MKLRNIFTALAVAALTFVGCQEEDRFLDEVQVSQSLVTLDVNGGSADITVTATADWKIAEVKDVWPEVVTRDENGNVTATAPSWLKANVTSGAAGETKVTFSAEATTETRELVLNLECAGATQQLRVLQMAEKIETPMSTCAQVIAGEDGKIYRIKGVCTSIANTVYGNWYIDDGTGVVYVYGTLYQGATKQFEKHGLEVGDIVTIEGPRKDYSGTIEMIDVTVLDIEKSLIKVEKVLPEGPISLEGGKTTAILTVKDGDFSVVIPEDASWLTAGEPYTVGTSTFVDLTAAPNEGGARKTTVTFKTKVGEKEYVAMADIEQEGAIAEVTVADFLAKPEGTALYKLTGKVGKIANTTYGNFDLIDATGKVYVYGLTNNGAIGSNDKKFAELGIKEGDVVTIIGTRAAYNGTAQVGGTAYLVSHRGSTEVTVAEFLAKEKSKDNWYKLTGKVTGLKTGNYGNFHLVDETGSVYVYGLTVAPVAKNDQSFPTLGIKEGDIVTLVGTRDRYDSAKVPEEKEQVGGPAYYISHETPAEGGDDNTGNEGVAGTYTHTFAQDDLGANGSPSAEVTLNGVKWNFSMVDSGSKYLGWDSNETAKGVQIGKSKDAATEVVLSTTGIAGTVKSIKVNTSGASGTDAKLNVTVGGAAFGSEVVLTTTATDYTLTGSASGEIVLKWTCTAKAIYIKSIEIVTE
ncbi:MAG: DNA-binding protein [Bacteroidales bacterium]|nr:DNA-binding protein [Bacteroidales bacterium]